MGKVLFRGYKEERICENCGKKFIIQGYRLREGRKGRFCSHKCYYEYKIKTGYNFAKVSRKERKRFNYTCLLCNLKKPSHNIVCHEEGTGKTAELFVLCRHCHTTIEMIKKNNFTLYEKVLILLREQKRFRLSVNFK